MAVSVAGPEIERLIQLLARMPGLGPRSARRAALHLIKKRDTLLAPLSEAMRVASERIVVCSTCGNVDTSDPCTICADPQRDPGIIVVVEDVSDLWALERAGALNARYHVLGGVLSPLDGVRPEHLNLDHRNPPGAQRHRRWPDDGALHHGAARPPAGARDAARAWRSRRGRTRLSRRGHALRRDPSAHGALRRERAPRSGSARRSDRPVRTGAFFDRHSPSS
jgi:hypothetical protein